MTDLNTLTIAEARDKLRAGEITSTELTEACLAATEKAEALNAVVHSTADLAREQVARPLVDRRSIDVAARPI